MLNFLSTFDESLFHKINALAGTSPELDVLVADIAANPMFKGVFVMLLFWGLWFSRNRPYRSRREELIAVLVIAAIAILAGRVLALSLPFRFRPLHDPNLLINRAFGSSTGELEGWSSMPSDHAAMFFALATGLYRVSRPVGIVALLHAVVVICLPRVYLGFHFPSDLLVGGLVGIAMSLILTPVVTRGLAWRGLLVRAIDYPSLFYPAAFFATLQVALMFEPMRLLLKEAFQFAALVA